MSRWKINAFWIQEEYVSEITFLSELYECKSWMKGRKEEGVDEVMWVGGKRWCGGRGIWDWSLIDWVWTPSLPGWMNNCFVTLGKSSLRFHVFIYYHEELYSILCGCSEKLWPCEWNSGYIEVTLSSNTIETSLVVQSKTTRTLPMLGASGSILIRDLDSTCCN